MAHAKTMKMTQYAYDLSLIAPCHNEQGNVRALYEAICTTFGDEDARVELILVDDGSKDTTFLEMQQVCAAAARASQSEQHAIGVQLVQLSRNFGKESALVAGMQCARGACVGFIDADLQQDPAIAREMFEYLCGHDECDVVAAYQVHRHEPAPIRFLKKAFYASFNAASDEIDIPSDMSDFRVFRATVKDAVLSLPEYFRFSKGIFAWVGFNTHAIAYEAHERHAGKSNWSVISLFKYAFGGILAFTTWPLKIAKYLGFFTSIAAAVYLFYVIIFEYLMHGIDVPGYPTLVCLTLIFGGLQLLVLGVIGEYLARDYLQGKQRPIYIARRYITSDEMIQTSPISHTRDDLDSEISASRAAEEDK